ncbi:sensor histidine kinase [Testudinibacter sp. P80/BLE/0925]|uniref:sensor histidine kinase n=1 Tax=Testudinibacter sp. TW-1 TaxID=3417757 RepID=UPI003D35AD7F
MKNSIRRKLILSLTLLSVTAALLTALFIFYASFKFAYRLQDDILQQSALFIGADTPVSEVALNNRDNQIFVHNVLTPPDKPYFIPNLASYADGLHSLTLQGRHYRAYIKHEQTQPVAVLFDEEEFRDEIAAYAAGLGTAPMLLFILLMLPLAAWVVQRSLRPINQLSEQVKQRSESDLTALDEDNIPTEIHAFVQSINHLFSKVDRSVRQQQRFIADAAHELRSPMTALSLQLERFLQQNTLPEAAETQLSGISRSVVRVRHLLEQLLLLARVQAEHIEPTRRIVSLLAVYRRVLTDLLPLADAKRQDIGVVSKTDCHILANEDELYLLIKILCENAIRYTPIGGQIDLDLQQGASAVILSVDDNGVGIAESERERVLEPFYRILGSGEQGTGLGLAIADNIVKRYRGRLILADTIRFAHGLSVKIRLPYPSLQAP